MVAIVMFPLAFMILGALLLALAVNATLTEIGKALFWAGAFALAYSLAGHSVRIG